MAAVATTTANPSSAAAPVPAGAIARESSYPMVPMVDAIRILLTEAGRAASHHPIIRTPLAQAVDMVLAENIIATEPFPPFRASVMDGYAVHSSYGAGVFPVVADLTAGSPDTFKLAKGSVAYITTGAPVPEGADAVLMVERTEAVTGEPGKVRLLEAVPIGEAIRPIGFDIPKGTTVLTAGERLGAAEIGLLASLGITTVPVYRKAVVTVLSTGNELVEAKSIPGSGQIRDSNRPMLLAAIQKAGAIGLDHGIAPDTPEALRAAIGKFLTDGDVCVMSGGVSMGSLDLLKPILSSLGTVHFGRLLMKPGKPATFATVSWPPHCADPSQQTTKLVFALPGNPVSALVCFGLLVEPAIKRLTHFYGSCTAPRVKARVSTSIKLDPTRPEYHRVILTWDDEHNQFMAHSTGAQASSRLMSLRAANGLLEIPNGIGSLPAGTMVTVLLTAPLDQPQPPAISEAEKKAMEAAAHVGCRCHLTDAGTGVAIQAPHHASHAAHTTTKHDHGHGHQDTKTAAPAVAATTPAPASSSSTTAIRVALLTVSDRCHRGESTDLTGPAAEKFLLNPTPVPRGVNFVVSHRALVPDEPTQIQTIVKEWTDSKITNDAPHLVLTLGGTGFSPRDLTPEAITPLLQRQAPGIVHAMVQESLKHTPMAVLSRPVAGTRERSMIITLPGNPKAVGEILPCLMPSLPHALKLMTDVPTAH